MSSDPESFWTDILSEEPATISRALNSLSKDERSLVIEHLTRMANEPGWTPGQQRCVELALSVIEEQK